jgi:nitroimidazol reductase NimA-like FMN-containing flavoprotein (pyridoxamine 5'-phosphate oxidase superfamily)
MSQSPDPAEARNVWFATVRPDGRPHLVPIWFVIEGDRWYVCMQANSVKARNLKANPAVSLALEDGEHPYVIEGQARAIATAVSVAEKFKAKYDWDLAADDQYTQMIEVTVSRRLLGG